VLKSQFKANIIVFYEGWSQIDYKSLSFDKIISSEPRISGKVPVESPSNWIMHLDNALLKNKVFFIDDYPEGCPTLPKYDFVAVGGSFDQLHNGHKKLLYVSGVTCRNELTVGITADSMLTNKTYSEEIQTFSKRFQLVRDFLMFIQPSLAMNLVEIQDPFGPTIVDEKLQALVVSSETISGAFKINEIRESKGMPLMDILVITRQDSAILSSTFLRKQKFLKSDS
jgi:pantetheine-phosphate adenylyltransferase